MTKKVNYVLEADIKGFFDNVNHDWLMKFLEHDIADKNFLKVRKEVLDSGCNGRNGIQRKREGDAPGWSNIASAGERIFALRA
jgi:retron-type reverse transcriptase